MLYEVITPKQEAHILDLLAQYDISLVVLARYMQVLSPQMCDKLDGWAINIHHSLLPGFKGARPYHQAWEKGVKMVGATAHYVNNDLDEGPIISQGIQSVDHAHYPRITSYNVCYTKLLRFQLLVNLFV